MTDSLHKLIRLLTSAFSGDYSLAALGPTAMQVVSTLAALLRRVLGRW